ncbi:hypothetical protein HK097_006063, partial [Rhizophlyctis rosea]
LNSGSTPSKRSKIDRQMNPQVLVNFLLLCVMCLVCAIVAGIYSATYVHTGAPFAGWLERGFRGGMESPAYTAFVTFFSSMIVFQTIIPIALYISVDVSKTYQSFMIYLDNEMYDEESDKRVAPQSWNLCDDLGQIEYIFSDKTGTLTCNMMDFRKCSINGVMYGKGVETDVERGRKKREPDAKSPVSAKDDGPAGGDEEHDEAEREMRKIMAEVYDTKFVQKGTLPFVDPKLAQHIKEGGNQAMRIREFFTLLAVCHTVLVEVPDESQPTQMVYKAQSPDEAALVSAARDSGFAFLRRRENLCVVDVLGEERCYTILNVLEFNSDRKRMSVVMRRPEGEIVVLTKGADSVIFERLKRSEGSKGVLESTESHLEGFANEGLRTLCLAWRVISEEHYESWRIKYDSAKAQLEDRDAAVDAVAEEIERDLTLMGATAIEDKLQEGVPECVDTLSKAGIKVWVLTGDKMETAINIGFACNLLKRDMTIIVVRSGDLEETERQLGE